MTRFKIDIGVRKTSGGGNEGGSLFVLGVPVEVKGITNIAPGPCVVRHTIRPSHACRLVVGPVIP